MDEEELIMMSLLKAEERRSKRPYVSRRGNPLPTHRPLPSSSSSTRPPTHIPSEEESMRRVYEAAGLGVPEIPRSSPSKTPPAFRSPSSHLAGMHSKGTPVSSARRSEAEEIDRSDLLEDVVPNASFQQSVERLLAAVQTPTKVERELDFARERPIATPPLTPHKNVPHRQQELLKLFRDASLDKDEEVKSLQHQLSRRFSLAETCTDEGVSCVIAKLPAASEGEADMFSGDAAVSAIVNICDGTLCRLISRRAAKASEAEAISLAMTFTDELLAELEAELTYATPEAQTTEDSVHTVPDLDLQRLKRARVVGGDFGHALDALVAKAEVLGRKPHHALLQDVVANVTRCVSAAEDPLTGAHTENDFIPHDQALHGSLHRLKLREEEAKASGKLEESAKLRVEGLRETAEWLKTSLAPNKHDTSPVMSLVQLHTEGTETTCARQEHLASELDTAVWERQAAVMNCEGVLANTLRQHQEEEVATRGTLAENTTQIQDVMRQMEQLQIRAQDLFEERCNIVKQRVVKVGEFAMTRAVTNMRLANLKTEYAAAEAKAASVRALHEVVGHARRTTSTLQGICTTWERTVHSREAEKQAALEDAVQRVWTQYQADHEAWCLILERSVSAMEGRKVLLDQLRADAEERYDETDRDHAEEDTTRATQRMQLLSAELRERREEFLCAYSQVRDVVASPPPRESSPGMSAQSGSPEGTSPGYTSSLSPVRDVAVYSATPQAVDAMRHVSLADALASLGKDASQTAAWLSHMRDTDIVNVADLYQVYSIPAVWKSFIPQMPLLKTELALLLQRHTSAAARATPHPIPMRTL